VKGWKGMWRRQEIGIVGGAGELDSSGVSGVSIPGHAW
jgi:hypothetical protein